MTSITHESLRADVKAILDASFALRDAIKDLGQVPAGHLYAMVCMHKMSAATFDGLIGLLVKAGLVGRKDHLLIWKGN